MLPSTSAEKTSQLPLLALVSAGLEPYTLPSRCTDTGTDVLVITPTYNERENLSRFVAGVHAVLPHASILVVDDASPDGTGAIADSLSQSDPRIRVLHRPDKLGLGTAYAEAFVSALAGPWSRFVTMDADLSHDPAHLPSLLAPLSHGVDLVLGSRGIPGGKIIGWGPGRYGLSKGGSFYARFILGLSHRDLTSGYKVYSRRALEQIDPSTLRSNGYAFQIETTYRALQAGLTVVEVPIVFVDRTQGKSKMDRAVFLEAILMVWRLRFQRKPRQHSP